MEYRKKIIHLATVLSLTFLLSPVPVSASPILILEVGDIIANVNHALDGIQKVDAIYDSTAISTLIIPAGNDYYPQLEKSYLSYKNKYRDWQKTFYQQNKIPNNIYIQEIPPIDGKSNHVKYFAYIITKLNKDACNLLHTQIKYNVQHIYINKGKAINITDKITGKCEDQSDNEIVVLR